MPKQKNSAKQDSHKKHVSSSLKYDVISVYDVSEAANAFLPFAVVDSVWTNIRTPVAAVAIPVLNLVREAT
jgi:hypothetical protein